ncbi:MAG: TlpA family protein disulfide reductase [Endomicrobia bacterium]|nr:TlpA family protein disulfide reductase [Endomicrobiia bacterium]
MKTFFFIISNFFIVEVTFSQNYQNNKYNYIDFELIVINSTQTIKLSNIIGEKVVLLNFWTTWCPYCRKEIPRLKQIYNKYKNSNLEIISINLLEPQKIVNHFIKENDIKYKVALDIKAEVAKKYKIKTIPTNFLIDIDGYIVYASNYTPSEGIIDKCLALMKNKNVKEKKLYNKQKNKQ